MKQKKDRSTILRHRLSGSFIYSVIIPIVVLDIWSEVYHQVCFFLYKIPYVKRSNYIKIDRHKLKKLSFMDKFNCVYCGYVNGWINYIQEIAARTEKYWCAIKHEEYDGFVEPAHHKDFSERKEFM